MGVVDSPQLVPEGLKTDGEDSADGGGGGGGGGGGEGGGIGSARPIDLAPPALSAGSAIVEGATEIPRADAQQQASAGAGRGGLLAGSPASSKAASGAGGAGKRGDEKDHGALPRCESADDSATRMGSFYLPSGGGGLQGGAEVASAGSDGRRGAGGGGDVGSDAESEAALTATETPAAGSVAAYETGGRGSRGAAGRPGEGGARSPWGRDVDGALERRGSLLDAYREPEGNDWAELEDWQGLPGLGLASGTGAATTGQVSLRLRLRMEGGEGGGYL